jgi:hypothetical protein
MGIPPEMDVIAGPNIEQIKKKAKQEIFLILIRIFSSYGGKGLGITGPSLR